MVQAPHPHAALLGGSFVGGLSIAALDSVRVRTVDPLLRPRVVALGEFANMREDVLAARQFDDAIAQCGAPIEEHHAGGDTRWEYVPDSATYGIPYRCLLPLEVEGMIVAGRCLSASHDAHASVRSIGQCLAMGQAAGTAAALSVRMGVEPRTLPPALIREKLGAMGAVL